MHNNEEINFQINAIEMRLLKRIGCKTRGENKKREFRTNSKMDLQKNKKRM